MLCVKMLTLFMLTNSLKEFKKLCGTFPVKQEHIIAISKVKKLGGWRLTFLPILVFIQNIIYTQSDHIFSNTLLHKVFLSYFHFCFMTNALNTLNSVVNPFMSGVTKGCTYLNKLAAISCRFASTYDFLLPRSM